MAIQREIILSPADLLLSPEIGGLYEDLKNVCVGYDTVDAYLRGDHDLRFATEKFSNAFGGLFRKFANNYCKRVVQTLADYVQLDTVEMGDETLQSKFDLWRDSQRLSSQGGVIHYNSFAYGDSYVILAEDPNKKLRLYRQNPRCCRVLYDPEQPDQIKAAIKVWRIPADNSWRMTVYIGRYAYRYQTMARTGSGGQTAKYISGMPSGLGSFFPLDGGEFVKSPIDAVPVFYFANDPDASGLGVSELSDIRPLQDALNKSICDMLVAMEFQAYRQRYATGIEIEMDEDTGRAKQPPFHGADRLWIAEGENAKFGEFSPIDLTQFLGVSESFRTEIARTARIPVHHLMMTSDFPSGEALKVAEQPLTAKVRDRQISWGNVWEDVAKYWAAYSGVGAGDHEYTAKWQDVSPRSAAEQAQGDLFETQVAQAKVNLGVPLKQVLSEMGYTDEQVAQFLAVKAAEPPPVPAPPPAGAPNGN